MASFWRDVFDLSERSQSPARLRAATQVGAVVGALALIAALTIGFASRWSSTTAIILLIIPVVMFGLAVGSHLELYRQCRRAASQD